MAIVQLLIDVEYDPALQYNDDPEAKEFFFDEILSPTYGKLELYSRELEDTIGKVIVRAVKGVRNG